MITVVILRIAGALTVITLAPALCPCGNHQSVAVALSLSLNKQEPSTAGFLL